MMIVVLVSLAIGIFAALPIFRLGDLSAVIFGACFSLLFAAWVACYLFDVGCDDQCNARSSQLIIQEK